MKLQINASPAPDPGLDNRNVIVARGRTSMRLEPAIWSALAMIAKAEGKTLDRVIQAVEAKGYTGGRTTAVRAFVVTWLMDALEKAQSSPASELAAIPVVSAAALERLSKEWDRVQAVAS